MRKQLRHVHSMTIFRMEKMCSDYCIKNRYIHYFVIDEVNDEVEVLKTRSRSGIARCASNTFKLSYISQSCLIK